MGRWHADAVRRIGGRVTVIVDPDRGTLTSLGRLHPSARIGAELDPLLIAQHATVAHVCTPLRTHAALIARLIEARVHVLAEKPLTESAESSATLLSLAEGRGVLVCPVHQFLFQHGVRQLLRWLPDLGALRRVEFSACSAGAVNEDATTLDDLVADILPHPLALISALLRTPVAGVTWHVAHPVPGEFRALATVGGTIVDMAISAHGRPTENVLRAVADGGSATADLFHGYAVRHGPAVSRRAKLTHPFMASGRNFGGASVNLLRRVVRREPAYPGLRELVRSFYAAVSSGSAAPITSESVNDVALARDRLIARMRRLAPSGSA
jgi:predicted dehydrogenase